MSVDSNNPYEPPRGSVSAEAARASVPKTPGEYVRTGIWAAVVLVSLMVAAYSWWVAVQMTRQFLKIGVIEAIESLSFVLWPLWPMSAICATSSTFMALSFYRKRVVAGVVSLVIFFASYIIGMAILYSHFPHLR